MGNILEIDPQRRTARVQPGVVLDHLRNAAEKHHLTFGPDPATPRPLHPGRHDRQQLLRRAFASWRARPIDNIEALEVLTYDGLRMKVGQDQRCGAGADHSRRRPAGRDLRRPERTSRPLCRTGAPALSQHPAAGLRLQPRLPAARKWFQRGPRAGRHRRHLRHGARGDVRLVAKPASASARWCIGYPDIYQCADHVPDVMAHKPIGLEGIDDLLVEYTQRTRHQSGRPCAAARRRRLAAGEFGGETIRPKPTPRHPELMQALNRSREPAEPAAVRPTASRQSGSGKCASPAWARLRTSPAKPDLGGLGRLCGSRRKNSATICASLRQLIDELSTIAARSTATSARAASTLASTSICRRKRASRNFRAFMDEAADLVVATAARSPASTATARRGPSCCRRCSARSCSRAFREFKAIWDPAGR